MTEVKRELKTYRVYYICDYCKKGKVVFKGLLTGDGTKYVHKCSYCTKQFEFSTIYPHLDYEEVGL